MKYNLFHAQTRRREECKYISRKGAKGLRKYKGWLAKTRKGEECECNLSHAKTRRREEYKCISRKDTKRISEYKGFLAKMRKHENKQSVDLWSQVSYLTS